MNTLDALFKIFQSPLGVFAALKKERFWIPAALVLLALLVAHSALVSFSVSRAYAQYELSAVDRERMEKFYEEYREEIEAINEQVKDQIVDFSGTRGEASSSGTAIFISPGLDLRQRQVSVGLVSFLIALVLEIAYFRVISARMKLPYEVRDWIAFSVWSRIPAAVLALVGVLTVLLIAGHQADVTRYETFSVARWIPFPARPDRGVNLLHIDVYHLDAALIWLIALQTIGFREWSGKSLGTSLAVVAVPTAILYVAVLWFSMDAFFWFIAFDQQRF